MLVVDLMHEFELGVWKALFVHLLRILNAENSDLVHTLDQRYAHICPAKYIQTLTLYTPKLSPHSNLWQRHYPKICEQYLRAEKTCCP